MTSTTPSPTTSYNLVAQPETVAQGGVVTLSVPNFPRRRVPGAQPRYFAVWSADNVGTFDRVEGDTILVEEIEQVQRALTFPTVQTGTRIRWIATDTQPQTARVSVAIVELTPDMGASVSESQGRLVIDVIRSSGLASLPNVMVLTKDITVTAPTVAPTPVSLEPGSVPPLPIPLPVTLRRTEQERDPDQALWAVIRATTDALSFDRYAAFIDTLFSNPGARTSGNSVSQDRNSYRRLATQRALPFPDADAYHMLKVATELFMQLNAGVLMQDQNRRMVVDEQKLGPRLIERFLADEPPRIGGPNSIAEINQWFDIETLSIRDNANLDGVLPYLQRVLENLSGTPVRRRQGLPPGEPDWWLLADEIMQEKLTMPLFVELIWSYWHEEGMLAQAMKAISLRFQNRPLYGGRDPLATLEIDPLRPLNNLLWGYIQDEQHRLTLARRAFEYDHHYGITLLGEAVPQVRGADSRSRFLEAFHNLLQLCTIFFKEDDDTTVIADAFPVLNALREVHLLLAEGAHNQYRDLPWTSRQEMLMEQWILSRPEFREFLPRRVMVDYPEPWMHSVEAMKTLQGWSDSSILHFRDLARFGERILLSIRFGNWTVQIQPQAAANWARYFRAEVQGYMHAYRAVTGVDLTEYVDATMPAVLLQERLAGRNGAPRVPGRVSASLASGTRARVLPPAAAAGRRGLPAPAAQPAGTALAGRGARV